MDIKDNDGLGGITGFSWNYMNSFYKLDRLIHLLAKLHEPIKKDDLYDNAVAQTYLCMNLMKIITRP